MTEDQLRQYIAGIQSMVDKLNGSLLQIQDAIRRSAEAQTNSLKIAASAHDMSYLALRALAETNVEFRTILLRLAQEPAAHAAAQESRNILVSALAEHQRNAGQRPTLKPVPPSGSEP